MFRNLFAKKVKVKKLVVNAVIPKTMSEGAAGADLTAVSYHEMHGYDEYGTGLSISVPKGHIGLLFPRSSISDVDQRLSNSVGCLDEDYTGEIKFRFKRKELGTKADHKIYKPGDRIGQLVIVPIPKVEYEEVKELPTTKRGSGSFGSTNG